MFKRFCSRNVIGLIITAIAAGILAAFILPAWILAVCEAAIIVYIGIAAV